MTRERFPHADELVCAPTEAEAFEATERYIEVVRDDDGIPIKPGFVEAVGTLRQAKKVSITMGKEIPTDGLLKDRPESFTAILDAEVFEVCLF